ncbi:glycosyltransferase [Halopenitus persicus]|uniref:glycosyltransferase n=1 Tax=Halopenitus persicus TaxID=1048396 RepID=UPI000BBADDE7|nr:glycosyltransferase [Halopenitus persicus]
MSDNSLHVALVTPWNTGGGIANYSERLRDGLESVGVKVSVVPIRYPATMNPIRFDEAFQSIPYDADVIHVQYEAGVFGHFGVSGVCTPSFYARLARRDEAVVTTLHEVHRSYPSQGTVGNTILISRDWGVERLVLTVSDTVVVHTDDAIDILRERHGNRDSIRKLRHPVDDPVALPLNRSTAREKMSVTANTVLSTLGWVESKKRYEDVIRALPELRDTTYLIAGEPRHDADEEVLDETFKLAKLLDVRDRVQHVGYVADEDLPALFGATDLAVAPYEQVTQSGAVNTALAYRCPVLATALPAFEELAADYDCVQTYDETDDITNHIRDAVGDETRDRLRESTKRYVNTETWTAFAAETESLYAMMINSH